LHHTHKKDFKKEKVLGEEERKKLKRFGEKLEILIKGGMLMPKNKFFEREDYLCPCGYVVCAQK